MMLSFGAMVFIKRKHMIMKQSAINQMRTGNHGNEIVKMPNMPRNDNGFWMEPPANCMMWRPNEPQTNPMNIQKEHISGCNTTCENIKNSR